MFWFFLVILLNVFLSIRFTLEPLSIIILIFTSWTRILMDLVFGFPFFNVELNDSAKSSESDSKLDSLLLCNSFTCSFFFFVSVELLHHFAKWFFLFAFYNKFCQWLCTHHCVLWHRFLHSDNTIYYGLIAELGFYTPGFYFAWRFF